MEIKKIPTGKAIETFWKDIRGKKSNFKPWFETLKSDYCKNANCKNAKQKQGRTTSETIDKVFKNFKTVKHQKQI